MHCILHCIERSRTEFAELSEVDRRRIGRFRITRGRTHNATVASSSHEIPFCLTRRRIRQTSLICTKCSGASRERPIEACKLPCGSFERKVGALAELSTTNDERDRSRACAIVAARCFSRSPGINYRYTPTDVVVVEPHGASLKHAPLADALLRDARGTVSLRFFVPD